MLSAAVPDRLATPLERTATYRLPGHVRSVANSLNDRGVVNPATPMNSMAIALQPTDAQKAELAAFLSDVQNPASPLFHKWLTPEQYADRFGASTADIQKISDWLRSQGLTIDQASRGRRWVRFHGTASQVQTAFRTEIRNYADDTGEIRYANATAPAVPASLGPMILSLRGLAKPRHQAAGRVREPLYNVGNTHYLSPGDIATIYNTAPLLGQSINGTGQKVAILGYADVHDNDINTFRTKFGLPAGTTQRVAVSRSSTPTDGDGQEAALDVEAVSSVAPNATVILVYGDLETALADAIDNARAPVVTSSYAFSSNYSPGLCDSTDFISDSYYIQAEVQYGNAQGITVIASSGDTGAAGCETAAVPTSAVVGKGVGLPVAVPEVTAVGGTAFREGSVSYWNTSNSATGSSAKSYIPEVAWNDSAQDRTLLATGGGASAVFPKPFWQTGPGVPSDGMRDVPDVAMAASVYHDNFYMCWTSTGTGTGSGSCFGVGGTSVSAPLFAGIVALLNQYQLTNGTQTTSGQGNLNPGLYQMAQSTPAAFHDVTSGDNIVPCSLGSTDCVSGYLGFTSGVGYDQVTGLGSVDAYNLISNWNAGAGSNPTTTSVNAATGTVSQNSNLLLTVTVKAASGTSAPTGTVTFNATPSGSTGWQFLGTATLTGSGTSSTGSINFYPAQFFGSQPDSITAVYSGDGTHRSSGQTFTVSFQNAPANRSVVAPSINTANSNQGQVYAVDPDADGYRYFFEVDLYEFNGVATTLTDLRIDGVSYASQLNTLFGGTQMPAYGTMVAKLRWNPPTSPYTTYVEVSGRDANGATWTQQTPLIVASRQLYGNVTLFSDPAPVFGTSSSCPWSQQLSLFETNGRPVYLQYFSSNSTDLSSSIQNYFGTTRLAPYGALYAQICFQSNPGSVQWEVDGTDDLGNYVSAVSSNTFYGVSKSPSTLTVSPTTLSLNVPAANQTALTTLKITTGSSQPWNVYFYPQNKTANWLTVYPAGGTGSATVTVQVNGAGLATGTYVANLVVSGANSGGINTNPGIVSMPVVLTVGATGGISVNGLQNAASYVQNYAPGMLMAVYGSNLAPSTALASSIPLPTSLAGVSATVNGMVAPLWFVSPGQVNLQIPYETSAGQAVVGINNNGQVSYQMFNVVPAAPGIFSLNGSLNPDATASKNGIAFLYLTGEGDVTPSLATGATPQTGTPLSSLPAPIASLSVTVGGVNAPVVFAGVTPGSVGVTQVNFQLPTGMTGTQAVVVTVNGVASAPVNLTIN